MSMLFGPDSTTTISVSLRPCALAGSVATTIATSDDSSSTRLDALLMEPPGAARAAASLFARNRNVNGKGCAGVAGIRNQDVVLDGVRGLPSARAIEGR